MARTAAATATRRSRVHLYWGQDELAKRRAVAALISTLAPPEEQSMAVEHIDVTAPGVTGESILRAVRDRAMFSDARVVVVDHAGRLRGPRHMGTVNTLIAGLSTLPDYATLILVADAEDSDERQRSPMPEKLLTAIKQHGAVQEFKLPSEQDLARMAEVAAGAAEKRLDHQAAAMLAQRCPGGPLQLQHELEKLVAFVGDRGAITSQDIQTLVAAPVEDNIFKLIDSIVERNAGAALSMLKQTRAEGRPVAMIVPVLAGTLRQLVQMRFLLDHGYQPHLAVSELAPEILAELPGEGKAMRSMNEWKRNRLAQQARRLSWPILRAALASLALLDAGTKGWERGIDDPDVAFETFIVSLCQMPVPQQRPAARGSSPPPRPAYRR